MVDATRKGWSCCCRNDADVRDQVLQVKKKYIYRVTGDKKRAIYELRFEAQR